jgi:hypothetical protein
MSRRKEVLSALGQLIVESTAQEYHYFTELIKIFEETDEPSPFNEDGG